MDIDLTLRNIWDELYPGGNYEVLDAFIRDLEKLRKTTGLPEHPEEWYRDVVVYSLYVDLFNEDFCGLIEKLDYLQDLGVSCLWLLPILESPMRDAGFDISNYRKIRPGLLQCKGNGEAGQQLFDRFLEEAHQRGIRVIFDIAINHVSEEHPWFREAKKSPGNPYRDYFIWTKNTDLYKEARIIFEGLCTSNWEKEGEWYYFHRFFEFQPDLNYRNPEVLIGMCRNFIYWLQKGVDGFRADAIPYLWKEDGTFFENLPQTHTIVLFFRAVVEYFRPHTLLLAEACQKPAEVVKYFGTGDECNAGYHFPLMPQIFKSVAAQNAKPVQTTLSRKVTPPIPAGTQWFTFLRCHDELSLELVYVTEEDRKYIHDAYCKKPEWDFRQGQGISARLAELMDRDHRKINLVFSIMLTLPRTPVIYYGDEFAKLNDREYYEKMIRKTGKDDTRFLVRGEVNWQMVEKELADPETPGAQVFSSVSNMIRNRNSYRCFGRGEIEWLTVRNMRGQIIDKVMAFLRTYEDEKVLLIHNLSGEEQTVFFEDSENVTNTDLLGQKTEKCKTWEYLTLTPFSFHWFDTGEKR